MEKSNNIKRLAWFSEEVSNEQSKFSNFFILYFKKMCSIKQLLFYLLLFTIMFFSIGMLDFTEIYSMIAVLSIIIFFSFNYGLFIFNLKKSYVYTKIRNVEHYHLKNYGSILLNIVILSIFVYTVLSIGVLFGDAINFFSKSDNHINMIAVYGIKNMNLFWMFYSVVAMAFITVALCFFFENITKNIKSFFVLVSFMIFFYLVLDLLFLKISFCDVQIPWSKNIFMRNTIFFQNINHYSYYNEVNNTLYLSMGLQSKSTDNSYLILALFFPYFALQSIFHTSLYGLTFNSDFNYQILNSNSVLNQDTQIHEVFLPHIFHWNFTSYSTDDFQITYYTYTIYFLLTYFYMLLFFALAMLSRNVKRKHN